MTLLEFADKYSLDSQDLLELLKFEQFLIQDVNDELDEYMINCLVEFTGISFSKVSKKGKSSSKGSVSRSRNQYSNEHQRRDQSKKTHEDIVKPVVPLKVMSVSDLAKFSTKSVYEIINFFLKLNHLYSVNKELSIEEITMFCKDQGIQTEEQSNLTNNDKNLKVLRKNEGDFRRNPIVVVVGHIDHGKTTLLDAVRNSSVASMEKGGITQRIGASIVRLPSNNSIVFIDTPGHEAFCKMRSHGLNVADIAILVVAADDGVMPQTVESIKMIKQANLNIVVAINKIDKAGPGSVDRLYNQLTEHGIVVEQWGGTVPCMHISALHKQGIKELLEAVDLMSELLDLKTSLTKQAIGYILDSRMEKGIGPVCTVILHIGKLKVGDSFYAGSAAGRVVALKDAFYKNILEALPSDPVVLNGFDTLPAVGEILYQVEDIKVAKEKALNEKENYKTNQETQVVFDSSKKTFNIVLKANNVSSLEAMRESILKMKGKFYYDPMIISASVGNVNENDAEIAKSTNGIIYCLDLKENSVVKNLVKEYDIEIKFYDIIYKLFEDIEEQIEKQRPVKKIEKKTGELLILKLFHLKNKGTIAGFRVLTGNVNIKSKISLTRGKNRLYMGFMDSLQRDKSMVKELTKGQEGALFVTKFNEWQENDKIEVFSEVEE